MMVGTTEYLKGAAERQGLMTVEHNGQSQEGFQPESGHDPDEEFRGNGIKGMTSSVGAASLVQKIRPAHLNNERTSPLTDVSLAGAERPPSPRRQQMLAQREEEVWLLGICLLIGRLVHRKTKLRLFQTASGATFWDFVIYG
ncbi:hypothetical protein FQA47_000647 [Oryzias melastigma]|uniref:Uncharacterized protein n=1 Tax=Oryzias melastigma TaxID=30732 RepID=A0A834BWU8_ORYME|nr:hypothetical protein FQA47_000647 [Oryzias melastigma]